MFNIIKKRDIMSLNIDKNEGNIWINFTIEYMDWILNQRYAYHNLLKWSIKKMYKLIQKYLIKVQAEK